MAITWRNIGQSGNSGNSLIKSGGDTIAQGLNTLRGVAQDVSDEGTRQYNTQSDVNTAGVLADINRFSQEDIDNFDINSVTEQYGTQFDATGIADALDARVASLQEVAQQEAENVDRDLRTQSILSTNKLNQENLSGQIATRELADSQNKAYRDFSNSVTKDLGSYDSIKDLSNKITRKGQQDNIPTAEINKAIQEATGLYNTNIGLTPTQTADLAAWGQAQAIDTKNTVDRQYVNLDNEARKLGIIPEDLTLSSTPDTKETSPAALAKEYDPLVKHEWWNIDSVKTFETALATKFDDAGLPAPNGAELKKFLTLGFEDNSTFLTSKGLNIDAIDDNITDYINMRKNTKGIEAYTNARKSIDEGARETANKQAKALAKYQKDYIRNNKAAFNQEVPFTESPIPAQLQDFRSDSLRYRDWFDGVERTKKSSDPISSTPDTNRRSQFRSQRDN